MGNIIKYSITLISFSLIFIYCKSPFEYNVNDIPYFEPIDAPEATKGFQVHVPPFPIPKNYEREIYLRTPIGNTEDIYVNRYQIVCRPGSHHTIIYGYEDENDPTNPEIGIMREQNLPDGRPNSNLIMRTNSMYCGSQQEVFDSTLPPGIAIKIPAHSTVDVNSHYYNFTDYTIFGEVYLNFFVIPKDSVVETLVFDEIDNSTNLYLPKNQVTNIEYSEFFEETVEIRQMFSHMHKRGYMFKVYKVGGDDDGALLYESYDYRHPRYEFFNPPLLVKEGEGLRTVVGYLNETDREITFGLTTEDEMGVLFYAKKSTEQ